MNWKEILAQWKIGIVHKYPNNIKKNLYGEPMK